MDKSYFRLFEQYFDLFPLKLIHTLLCKDFVIGLNRIMGKTAEGWSVTSQNGVNLWEGERGLVDEQLCGRGEEGGRQRALQ